MYNENQTWFTQSLYSYKDKIFGSDSTLDISISSNTSDFNYFSSPNLLISIISDSDRSRKNCNLSYVDLIDLLLRIKQIQKDIVHAFSSGVEILCKYQNRRTLKFSFLIADSNGEKVIEIEIRHNESDFGKIYIPFGSIFLALVKKLEVYSNTCDQLSASIINRYLMVNLLKSTNGLRDDIKVIPGQILSTVNSQEAMDKFPDSGAAINSDDVANCAEDSFQDNFNGFMDQNINDIKISEIDNNKLENNNKAVREINSPFIYNTLGGKIEVLEDMIYSLITEANPFIELIKIIQESFKDEILPGLSDNDKKSYTYLSGLIFHTHLKNYSRHNNPIPSTTNILKYKCNEQIGSDRVELVYDLLTIGSYIKIMRNRIEDKEQDAMKNKSILYLAYRCFTDVLIFSFLDNIDKNVIQTCVIERFKVYKEKGVFKSFDQIINSYNCTEITGLDITTFISKIINNIVGKGETISELHNNLYNSNSIVLPSINNLSLEQINKLIKLEVENKLGNFDKVDKTEFDNEIIELFKSKRKNSVNKTNNTTIQKDPHVYRLVYQYRNEIPESIREELLTYLKDINTNDVVWNINDTAIEELGENVIKAIYIWNESDKNGTYKDFVSQKFEECLLTKDLILAKLKNLNEEQKDESSSWDDIDF